MKWNAFDYLKPETFPQVGDVVLWCDENGEMQVGYMDRGHDIQISFDAFLSKQHEDMIGSSMFLFDCPAAWMPLPAPPSSLGKF